jgi:RNA polymerase sigma-70 factor (ECF subfamily)
VLTDDRSLFRQVYEKNVSTVFAFLRARVGHDAAEDLTAETFCRAYQHYEAWEDRGLPIRAWLLRIARNLVIAESRKGKAELVPIADHHAVDRAPGTAGVDDSMEGAAALAALASLPENHRTVLQLRYLQELSVGETAAVMSLSEEGVRALAYRALKGLRALHLATWGDAPEPARES